LEQLLAVVIGGVLAIAGGFASGWFQHRLAASQEKRRIRAAKLEELVASVFELGHWIEQLRGHELFDRPAPVGPSPISKMVAIAATYFSENEKLEDKIRQLERQADEYYAAVLQAVRTKNTGNFSIEAVTSGYPSFLAAQKDLIEELRVVALQENE
jgi:hypothetical protein